MMMVEVVMVRVAVMDNGGVGGGRGWVGVGGDTRQSNREQQFAHIANVGSDLL